MLEKFRAYQQAKAIYQDQKSLRLKGAVRDQLERASLSICLNLAEGSGKSSTKERRRFYNIALGSLREVQALLDLLQAKELACRADFLGATLWRLYQNPGSFEP